MAVVKIIIQIIFILLCIALTVLVLMQEGKSAGLGAISGMQRLTGVRTRDVPWKAIS